MINSSFIDLKIITNEKMEKYNRSMTLVNILQRIKAMVQI
jgi:hypothetical protein